MRGSKSPEGPEGSQLDRCRCLGQDSKTGAMGCGTALVLFVMQEGSLRVVCSPEAAGRGFSDVDYSRPRLNEADLRCTRLRRRQRLLTPTLYS